jgi:hypothetical protein
MRKNLLFLKKKKQKDFHPLSFVGHCHALCPNGQKFSGSFFQERTLLLPFSPAPQPSPSFSQSARVLAICCPCLAPFVACLDTCPGGAPQDTSHDHQIRHPRVIL